VDEQVFYRVIRHLQNNSSVEEADELIKRANEGDYSKFFDAYSHLD